MPVKTSTKHRMTSEERKASIIDAACRLFADKGFRGVTTRELAAAVGVTEPVLYEHFRTKSDLYSAIIERKANESFSTLQELISKYADVDDDEQFFIDFGDRIIEWYTRDPAFIRLLLFSSLESHELRQLFQEKVCLCFKTVGGYIVRRMERGALKQVDPELAGRAFFGMVAHYAMTGLVFGNAPLPHPPDVVVRQMVKLFLHGISASQPSEERTQ